MMTSLPPLGVCVLSSSMSASIAFDSGTELAIGIRSLPLAAASATVPRSLDEYLAMSGLKFLLTTALAILAADGLMSIMRPLG